MRILVLSGNQRSTLAVVRSLGKRGHELYVGEAAKKSLAGVSRFTHETVQYPSPQKEPEAFIRELATITVAKKIDVLIPMTDVSTAEVSKNHRIFPSNLILGVERHEKVTLVQDKARLLGLAKEAGIRIPETFTVSSLDELRTFVAKKKDYPYVVKSSGSKVFRQGQWIHTRVRYVQDERDAIWLLKIYEENPILFPLLVQRRILGPGVGFFALCERGVPRVSFAHERIREKPPSGGVSVLRKSIPMTKVLQEPSARLLQKLDWNGPAMVEYKQDRNTGDLFLMEVNGRFWGSLQLAIDAGVDFPSCYLEYLFSKRLPVQPDYQTGIQSRWLLGDLDHLLAILTKSRVALRLPELTFSKRMATLVSFLCFWDPHTRFEVLRRKDLMPFLFELKSYVAAFF